MVTAAELMSTSSEGASTIEVNNDSSSASVNVPTSKRPPAYFVEYKKRRKKDNGPMYRKAVASWTLYNRKHYDPAQQKLAWEAMPEDRKKRLNANNAARMKAKRSEKRDLLVLPMDTAAGLALLSFRTHAGVPSDTTAKWTSPYGYKMTRVVPPPQFGSEGVLGILCDFWSFLTDNPAKVKMISDLLNSLCVYGDPQLTGVRMINGGRYELFMDAPNMADVALRKLIRLAKEVLGSSLQTIAENEVLERIKTYAVSQAMLDPRTNHHRFGNFGFILSYTQVKAQDVHIDLSESEHLQCALMASTKSFATSECEAKFQVATAEDLNRIWTDVPAGVVKKIGEDSANKPLLQSFGSILGECRKVNTDTRGAVAKIGTVTTLPGMVPHRGPPSAKPRMVLFFTATPLQDDREYDVNVQYGKIGLIHELLAINWVSFNKEEKAYMLQKLATSLTSANVGHLTNSHLVTFAKSLLSARGEKQKSEIVQSMAGQHWTQDRWMHE